MKFKTNHSHGPFSIQEENEFANCMILDSEGYKLAEQWSTSSDVIDAANMNLFKAAPSMLEYMMDRANCIEKEICLGVCYDPDGSKEELQTILSILKDAGVEVIE